MTQLTQRMKVRKSVFVIAVVAAVTLLAFALRAHRLVDVPPRWDEGWSVAHASLNLLDLFTVTSADVHPPLFYMLLGLWQWLVGANLFTARYLAVLMSMPIIPLTFVVTRAWVRRSDEVGSVRIPLLATILIAWLPLAVYYSAVIRMYTLAPVFVLLACWAGLRIASHKLPAPYQIPRRVGSLQMRDLPWRLIAAFVIGSAGAMYTLYHAAWVLAALGVYLAALVMRTPNFRRYRLTMLAIAVGMAVVLFLPWALYAIPQLVGRAAAEAGNTAQQYSVEYFLQQGVTGLTLSYQAGWLGLGVLGLILCAGLVGWLTSTITFAVAGLRQRTRAKLVEGAHLLLPVLGVALTLLGVAIAARNWAFNARMLICAAPLFAIWLAWSLDQWMHHSRALAGSACLLLIMAYFTTSTDFVYQKSLEVFDPYNPHTYWQHLNGKSRSSDQVFFNVLSPAGFYALDRTTNDPIWSYALTWDPVIEPADRWKARIESVAQTQQRVWIVLYRGLAGENGNLRGWMDSRWYPAYAEWGEEDVFYGLYGMYTQPLQQVNTSATRWHTADGFDLQLVKVELAPNMASGSVVPVGLTWQANSKLAHNFKVFVHAFDTNGALIAQHDAQPLNDLRPMTSLPVNKLVQDHHGLALPPAFSGKLHIVLGLYDPQTGQRIATETGSTEVELGEVAITP